VEIGFHDDNVIQIGSVENSSTSNRFRERSSSQVGIDEYPIINFTTKVNSAQASPSEVGFFEVSPIEIGVSEISPTQISIGENSPTKLGVSENSPTQISTPEISPNDFNLAKIPLTRGISSEQLLSSHNPTSYNFDNSASLLATDNEIIHPSSVEYNPTIHTATLNLNGFEASEYQLIIDDNLQNPDGITLKAPYQVDFTAVSDFSELVDLKFTNTRSDRAFLEGDNLRIQLQGSDKVRDPSSKLTQNFVGASNVINNHN
jgi:hypothetical protein